ncbi:hypothetical protein CsSME_00050622 [Camellia sinensis var. sinensis]
MVQGINVFRALHNTHTWFLLNQEGNLTLQRSTCQANKILIPHFERIRINILSQRPTERDLDHHISIMSAPLENPNEDLGLGWDIENCADLSMAEESASSNAQPSIPHNTPLHSISSSLTLTLAQTSSNTTCTYTLTDVSISSSLRTQKIKKAKPNL